MSRPPMAPACLPARLRQAGRDCRRRGSRRRAAGHTLIELIFGLAVTTILMGAMVASISVAARGLDGQTGAVARAISASDVAAEINADLALALAFTERTETAATFLVPDRTGDGQADLIRYWLEGNLLKRSTNGGAGVVLAEDVRHFRLTYVVRNPPAGAMGVGPPGPGTGDATASRQEGPGNPQDWAILAGRERDGEGPP